MPCRARGDGSPSGRRRRASCIRKQNFLLDTGRWELQVGVFRPQHPCASHWSPIASRRDRRCPRKSHGPDAREMNQRDCGQAEPRFAASPRKLEQLRWDWMSASGQTGSGQTRNSRSKRFRQWKLDARNVVDWMKTCCHLLPLIARTKSIYDIDRVYPGKVWTENG